MPSNALPIKLYKFYDLQVADFLAEQSGYRNHNYPARLTNDDMVNLIVYKREPGILTTIANSHRVADLLAARGFPTRTQYDSRILRLRRQPPQYAGLYYYLPGQTIAWESYTMEHLKVLGGSMGVMHGLLQAESRGQLPLAIQQLRALLSRMDDYFAVSGVRRAARAKLGILPSSARHPGWLAVLDQLDTMPSRPLHLDFVRGNILFEAGTARLSGVIDFEKVAFGHPLLDVARTLAFLLVDCKYKPEAKIRKYFLQSGYAKRGGQSDVMTQSDASEILEVLVDIYLLHDFYKFLCHNPYESLAANEHYVRTVALLVERGGLVRSGGSKLQPQGATIAA